MKNLKRTCPDISTKDKKFILTLCFTESSLKYEANHQGLYNGICGVNPFIWSDYLTIQGINYNSLLGGLMIYKYYLAETKNKNQAILKFKGVNKNNNVKKIANKILIIEHKLR